MTDDISHKFAHWDSANWESAGYSKKPFSQARQNIFIGQLNKLQRKFDASQLKTDTLTQDAFMNAVITSPFPLKFIQALHSPFPPTTPFEDVVKELGGDSLLYTIFSTKLEFHSVFSASFDLALKPLDSVMASTIGPHIFDIRSLVKQLQDCELNSQQISHSLGKLYPVSLYTTLDVYKSLPPYTPQSAAFHPAVNSQFSADSFCGPGIAQANIGAVDLATKAEQGCSTAQFNLGFVYQTGFGVVQDDFKAIKWYKKAAQQGHDGAQYSLGLMYYTGQGVFQNFNHAVEWFTEAADRGYIDAQNQLGDMYRDGDGVQKDLFRAFARYTQAARQGDAYAQYNLGRTYFNGHGVTKNLPKAIEWFTKAADQGNADAQNQLGVMHSEHGSLVTQDFTKSATLCAVAAQKRDIGVMYRDGVPQDVCKAIPKAADNPLFIAPSPLGVMYQGVPQDVHKKPFVFDPTKDDTQCVLGDIYYYGDQGLNQNFTKAAECYTNALKQGNTSRDGVAKKLAEIVELCTKDAEQGNADAQNSIGDMYYNGYGVDEDKTKAFEWFTKAAEQDNTDAQNRLGHMYYNGEGVNQDNTKAFEWFTKAAEEDNAVAQYRLGKMYYNGEGVDQDKTKAREWYTRAAEQDHEDAQKQLDKM